MRRKVVGEGGAMVGGEGEELGLWLKGGGAGCHYGEDDKRCGAKRERPRDIRI